MAALESVELRVGVSPLHRSLRLESVLRVRTMYIKRDDLLGRVLGGNKLRKLEYILPNALAEGADTLITTGSFESNHVCLTAAVARALGLHAAVVLMGPAGQRDQTFNEKIQQRLGVETRTVEYIEGDPDSRAALAERVNDCVVELTENLRRRGRRPFFVPPAGCCLEGTYAFVVAFDELHEQMRQLGHAGYDVFLAVGTGSTYAGLWCGATRAAADVRIRGISIARANPRCTAETRKAAERVCDHLGLARPQDRDLDISDAFVGDGYAKATPWSTRGIAMAMETEGLLLDHTYTGKTLGAMAMILENEPSERPVVFWHTGGVSGAIDSLMASSAPPS